MTTTTRSGKRTVKPTSDATGTTTVTVVEPHLVFHDGEQRAGTLTNVAADTATYWQKHGWVTIVDPETDTTAT